MKDQLFEIPTDTLAHIMDAGCMGPTDCQLADERLK